MSDKTVFKIVSVISKSIKNLFYTASICDDTVFESLKMKKIEVKGVSFTICDKLLIEI